jgi:Co/Zn/Cd efflux system component/predicted transcriptional regulator
LVTQFEIVGTEFGTRIVSGFFSKLARPAAVRSSKSRWGREEPEVNVEIECKNLLMNGSIELNNEQKYQLTDKGRSEAQEFSKKLEVGADFFNKVLSPAAAARNTVVVDLFLAAIKLVAGLFSGSVGLLADGVDSIIDTISASAVWIGMKVRKELLGALVIILTMFVGGISIGYDSVTTVWGAINGVMTLMTMPYLVIVIEGIALVSSTSLLLYQRLVGKRNGSLALISQSVDSKNHVYVAAAVIVGAIFAIFGIPFLDALVGAFVAVRILIDATGLSKEMLSSMRGEKMDLSKYEVPFEKQWRLSKLETFRIWILYSIKDEKLNTKDQIISSLEKTFKPEYVPILSEFRFSLGEGFNFDVSFNDLIEPLLKDNLLIQRNDEFIITNEGRNNVDRLLGNMRFRQSDLI